MQPRFLTSGWLPRDGFRGPLLAVAFASLVCAVLLTVRIGSTGHWRQLYLAWNLFLAWMPLVFACMASALHQLPRPSVGCLVGAWLAWLFFFPNAPYILTDIVHLDPSRRGVFWVDLTILLMFAFTGLVIGFLSLYMMQQIVSRRFGWPVGWLFVGAVTGLSGFGICIGRFLRWNSWDVVVNPLALLKDSVAWLMGLPADPRSAALPPLFAILLFVAYLVLYAFTGLPGTRRANVMAAEPALAPHHE